MGDMRNRLIRAVLRLLPAAGRAAALALAVALIAGAAEAEDEPDFALSYTFGRPDDPSEAWRLAYGGRLYDSWWNVLLSEPPTATHPAYPEAGAMTGSTTWRCVECHGWDYRGDAGAYGEGPHYTGVRGLRGMIGAPPGEIATIVRDATHRYTAEMIPDGALWLLALFVSQGQHDASEHIDAASGALRGDVERGRAIYQNVCAVCHDFDGLADTTGEGDGLRSLSAVAAKNPWRALHKVQNGQPGADMPAMLVFGMQTASDVLAYAQTLGRD